METAGRAVAADGVDQNDGLGILQIGQQRQAEGSAVEDLDPLGGLVALIQQVYGHRPQAIVAEQEVAETEDEQRDGLLALAG